VNENETTKNQMDFASTVRKVEGLLGINFFAGQTDNAAFFIKPTTTNRATNTQARQLFQGELEVQPVIASFDRIAYGDRTNKKGIPLNCELTKLVDRKTITGWVGNRVSNEFNKFEPAQIISIEYTLPRRLPWLTLRSVDRVSYPTKFNVSIFQRSPDSTNSSVSFSEADTTIVDNEVSNFKEYGFNFASNSYFDESNVVRVTLEILEWSLPNTLPRIAFFSGEMHESFTGDNLRSLEILEEKTSIVDRLSYGISSNYLKASFLNRDRQFYERKNFEMLRPNRSVKAQIKCGEKKYSLGTFYSKEWKLDDASHFMNVKAYDILYSLQNVIINYGMNIRNANSESLDIRPYKNVSVKDVISEIFKRIGEVRRDNGLFDVIREILDLCDSIKDVKLPFVLINKKSAWDVLKELANSICAFVYANRDGKIEISGDTFANAIECGGEKEVTLNRSYKKEKRVFTENYPDSIAKNGLHEYTYKANMFVTNDASKKPEFLVSVAKNIIDKYKNGVTFVDTTWKGDAGLGLSDMFKARSMHEPKVSVYETLSNEMVLSNGFRQTTKGRTTEDRLVSDRHILYSGEGYVGDAFATNQTEIMAKALIDPDNAFSFNLPVNNRVIVNQVRVEYWVLVECNEPEAITVNKADCNVTPIVDQNNNTTGYRIITTVVLEKVYDEIREIIVRQSDLTFVKVIEATASSLVIELQSPAERFDEFVIQINRAT